MPRKLCLLALCSLHVLCAAALSRADDRVYTLSDHDDEVVLDQDTPLRSGAAETDHQSSEPKSDEHYPSQVCHHPGTPQKPFWDRPGDRNESWCPPVRYGQDDCFRAGWPHAVRKWATCSINPHYSASYVGGGAAAIFPHARGRTCEEGTWGLDYSLWCRPRQVWMLWTHGREQGGLGAYETDH